MDGTWKKGSQPLSPTECSKESSGFRPRFFDQVGHQTMSAYIENKHFFTKSCHRQTHQHIEQPPQSLENLYI